MIGARKTGRRYVGLQSRFLLGLAGILVVFSLLAAGLIYFYEKNAVREEAFQKTEIVMTAVGASRAYVREMLRPRMYELLGEDDFVIEAMSSSFISRAIMDRFKEKMPDFEYRRVALNARNEVYEATEKEKEMIRFFQDNPDKAEWRGMVRNNGRLYFMRYQPVVFRSDCGNCHGAPEAAPAAIRSIYGDERGFRKDPDVIEGLVSVGIPVDTALAKTREITFSVFGTIFLTVFFLFGIITFFFNRLVVQNLRQVLSIFRDTLLDERSGEFQENIRLRDDIDDLTVLAGVMAGHLKETREELRRHAATLEQKVAERTRELMESENLLREKVLKRNRELNTLNVLAELITGAMSLEQILPKVLEHSLRAVPAKGAGIYLLDGGGTVLRLQCHENAPQLVEELEYTLADRMSVIAREPVDYTSSICDAAYGHLNFFTDASRKQRSLNLPLCCRDKVLGVMTFVGTGFDEITAEMQELLFSIGRQVGITIESLQNLDELVESRNLLQSVFDGITDLVVLVDSSGRFRMVNRAFVRFCGKESVEITGLPVRSGHIGRDHPFAGVTALLQNQECGERSEYVQTSEGIIFDTHFYPICDREGSVVDVVCYAKDVTEQKNIEQRIRQAEKLLALGQMAAGVAHEINNPLGVILCYADILKDDLAGSPQPLKDLEIIEKHARSCQHIVSDLLDFARAGETVRKTVELNMLIEDVLTIVRAQMRKEHIRIVTDLSPELPPVSIDPDKMRQVVVNLILNAAQAIADEGEIGIYSVFLESKEVVQLVVEDNGSGIGADIIDKVFDPFFTTKEPGQGTGLGLSLAYGIVKDHAGEIEVESEPGNWTRFTVTLPVAGNGEEHRSSREGADE
ncbi:MAG: DUF3365 domain-containing protein [Desulfobulbaceae bacterium]